MSELFVELWVDAICSASIIVGGCLIISILLDTEELERFVEKREKHERKS